MTPARRLDLKLSKTGKIKRGALMGLSSINQMVGLASIAFACSGSVHVYAQMDSGRDTAAFEEIIVTATKRAVNVRDVPITITAVTEQQMQQQHITEIADLAAAIPNVVMPEGGSANTAPIIRGVMSNTRNAGVESGVSVYVDGVYTGRPETFNQALEDASSVELLQGPQGTLFGKNSIAGAISVNTNDPTNDLSLRVSGEYGNYDHQRLSGTVNVPIVDGLAAGRISAFREKRDGHVKNLGTGPDLGSRDGYGVRAKFLLTPSDNWRAVLAFDYNKEDSIPYMGENLLGREATSPPPKPIVAPGPYTVSLNPRNQLDRELWGTSLTLEMEPFDGYNLTSITAYRRNTYRIQGDEDSSVRNEIFIDWSDAQSQFSQEIRLRSPDENRFKFVMGLYYFAQDSDTAHIGGLGPDFIIPGLIAPGTTKVIVPQGEVDTRSYATYLDASFDITDRIILLGGLRITHEKKNVMFSVQTDPGALPLFYDIPMQRDVQKQTDFSPTVGLRFELSETVNSYIRLSRGYKSGGWNMDFVSRGPGGAPTIQSLAFKPEKVTNYEAGIKGDLLDKRLRINLSAYYMTYDDMQVTQFFGFAGGAVTSNAASATIKGFGGDFSALLAPGLRIGGSLGYNDASYDKYQNVNSAGDDASGNRLPGPKWTAEGNASYDFALPGELGALSLWAQVSYRGAAFGDVLNQPRLATAARTIVNSSIVFTPANEHFTLALWARNLFDKRYFTSLSSDQFAFPGTLEEIATYAEPRTYGVTLTAQF